MVRLLPDIAVPMHGTPPGSAMATSVGNDAVKMFK